MNFNNSRDNLVVIPSLSLGRAVFGNVFISVRPMLSGHEPQPGHVTRECDRRAKDTPTNGATTAPELVN
jgi:hypothetical protein